LRLKLSNFAFNNITSRYRNKAKPKLTKNAGKIKKLYKKKLNKHNNSNPRLIRNGC